jgi:hypothetical protein
MSEEQPAQTSPSPEEALRELIRQAEQLEAEAEREDEPEGPGLADGPPQAVIEQAPGPSRPAPKAPQPRTPEDARRKVTRALALLVNALKALDAASKVVTQSGRHTTAGIDAAFRRARITLDSASGEVRKSAAGLLAAGGKFQGAAKVFTSDMKTTAMKLSAAGKELKSAAGAFEEALGVYQSSVERRLGRLTLLVLVTLICCGFGVLCGIIVLLAVLFG